MTDFLGEVCELVFQRAESRRDSLAELHRFDRLGFEGWLKVETVASIARNVSRLQRGLAHRVRRPAVERVVVTER